ncbi:hypothetical protein M947_01485 [Sulfurimonas hongkongensis]|uniref:Uncharacterized protein n=1 Tax=Sulfurimonas hongkongensis TaxID=1172190 RepID=T0L3S3_9BACT|nr:hypothetical protein [Sulfurimonas hongkongensis]EQB40498.1 hypothetical protein M947_01485 [Sulfurimonas hongkongensis]
MTKTLLLDKYPIYSLSLNKSEIKEKSVDEIVKYFIQMIEQHPIATNIAVFDHFKHTKNLGGEIDKNILNAKNVVFCFGAAIPNSKILAVRPRSIGIVEFRDSFSIEFMEAPNPKLQEVMLEWVMKLKNS